MGDDWRVYIAFGYLWRRPGSGRRALIAALDSRLGDQVKVSATNTKIFLYAGSGGAADEAAQVAREVLARHDVSAPVRTERWSPWDQQWQDATEDPSADVAAERQLLDEYRKQRAREISAATGWPNWHVRADLPSHREVVALAGQLTAQGWRVRPHWRHLVAGADCEDDAQALVQALSGDGDGYADAVTAFRVTRVSYSFVPDWLPPPS
jgi:hypothetical protein